MLHKFHVSSGIYFEASITRQMQLEEKRALTLSGHTFYACRNGQKLLLYVQELSKDSKKTIPNTFRNHIETIWNSHKVLRHLFSCEIEKSSVMLPVNITDGWFKTVNLSLTGVRKHQQIIFVFLH